MQETSETSVDQLDRRCRHSERLPDKSEDEYKNLCMAAVCRAQADWLIGMNGTRAYTTRYFKRLVVGRVQTPTLAMLAERQERIEHFQKEAFYKVALTDGKLTVVSENIANEEAADLLAVLCNGSTAVVTQMRKEDDDVDMPAAGTGNRRRISV